MKKPTDAELAILQVLWRKGPSTVKEVQEALGEETGYTTALKFLQIMTEKGLVRRDEAQRAHVYEACGSEDETQQQLVTGLLKKAFGGSSSKLVMQALASKRATPSELKEIKELVQRLAQEG
ncbi:MAG TPA: BlaI/MecI/CopY family transcriptional regulator [Chthoniobacteraceae bacterium]|nr:BlaI/MecI/CopY family transcriptional regulator [Chthoniobacteraceae bacterium]